jgi:RNA polymerase sigma-70 factor (ECF subfamily)
MPPGPRYEVIEDRYLVAAALSGSLEAYDELVRRYRGALILQARRSVASHEAAQDVAQEAFLIGFQRLSQLKDARQYGPWIRVIATHLARAVAQRESRTRPVEGEQMDRLLMAHASEQISDPENALLKKERDSAIRGLMGSLPEGVQIVLQLYYREQWSVTQIAEFLSLTRTTVKWRLHAGRKKIGDTLAAMTGDGPAGLDTPVPQVGISGANARNESGEMDHGKEQKERGQAHSPYAGRDRLACGG